MVHSADLKKSLEKIFSTPAQPKKAPVPRKKRSKAHRETEANSLQIPLVKWFKSTYPSLGEFLMHFPNEGKRTKHGGFYLKLMGMRPGVSDLFLAYPRGKFAGLWMELKMPLKKPSGNQLNFLQDMANVGYEIWWGTELIEAKRKIQNYLSKT